MVSKKQKGQKITDATSGLLLPYVCLIRKYSNYRYMLLSIYSLKS